MVYEHRNGQFVLKVTGHPDFGVPFGQNRIVPIFLATPAVRQKNQTIRFKTAAEMLETFGMHKDTDGSFHLRADLRGHDLLRYGLGPFGLVAKIGSVEYSRERRFAAKLEQWLRTIRVMWPTLIVDRRTLVLDHAMSIVQ